MPAAVSDALAGIGAVFTKHPSAEPRLCSNLLASQAQKLVNRSIADPIFLSQEMLRHGYPKAELVRTILKLYGQRALANPALAITRGVEEVTCRFMNVEKVARSTFLQILEVVVRDGWDLCCFNCTILNLRAFPIGAKLVDSGHDLFAQVGTTTAESQHLAVAVHDALSSRKETHLHKAQGTDRFNALLVACGNRIGNKNKLLPHIILGTSDVATLDALVADPSDGAFREELTALAGQEPSDGITDLRELADWAIERVATLAAAKHDASKAARAAAEGRGFPQGL